MNHLKSIIAFFIYMFPILIFSQSNSDHANIKQKIAEAYGVKKFHIIKTVRFTFNVNLQGKHIQRVWSWEPKTGNVSYKGNDIKGEPIQYEYNRKKLDKKNKLKQQVDKWFVNDQYWLMFPLHILWDKNLKIIKQDESQSPIKQKVMKRIIVKYPGEGGYSPGDIFEVFYNDKFLIKEWIYRAGGSDKPTRQSTWEKYSTAGPLLISLNHIGKKGFKQWFTGVSVQLNDNKWYKAEIIK